METKEWQRFYRTGRIEDYLIYKEAVKNDAGHMPGEKGKGEETVGHAGFCNSDRDGFTGASHGRI